jgi:LPXTG-motif cell wall-anchored protein
MNSQQRTQKNLRRQLTIAAGLIFLASTAAMNAQVQTTTETTHGTPTHEVKVETGTVVSVEGNDLFVKDSSGMIRHFANVPESARVDVNGQQLSIHQLKPGMTIERTTIRTTTPRLVTTVKTVTGTIWHVNPPSHLILTLENGQNQSFTIPKGQKFNVDGTMTDAWGLKKGMKIDATQVIEVPETHVTEQRLLAGTMPPPPPMAPEKPVLVTESAPAPVQVAAAPAAERLPATGSSLPLIGLLGLLLLSASFGVRLLRRS